MDRLHLLLFFMKVALHGQTGSEKITDLEKGASREVTVCWQCLVIPGIQDKTKLKKDLTRLSDRRIKYKIKFRVGRKKVMFSVKKK